LSCNKLDGIILDSAATIKNLIETRVTTKTNLKCYANIIDKIHETGKKASDDFLNNCRIIKDKVFGKWNYLAKPS
jgi:hypothetical protein